MRINWLKVSFILTFLIVIPVLLLYAMYWGIITFIDPILGLSIAELLEQPVFDILMSIILFFGIPSLFILAVLSFGFGVMILID